MITSGPRSYYDEYVRKRDTERAFAKPPALLTDRNAYINFLEVQLERVSSACFSVQSYEERFNDMQGLIVALDERCASTSKLLALAQQCTEVLLTLFSFPTFSKHKCIQTGSTSGSSTKNRTGISGK